LHADIIVIIIATISIVDYLSITHIIKGLFMYHSPNRVKEPAVIETKIGMTLSIISLFCVQFSFQIFTLLYRNVISYFQLSANFTILNPRELSSFAMDMWVMMILLSFFLMGYSMVKKVKELPLYLLIAYPVILIVLSVIRDVSSIQIAVLSTLSCAIVLKVNVERAIQFEFSKA
jgi:hypothetical protein